MANMFGMNMIRTLHIWLSCLLFRPHVSEIDIQYGSFETVWMRTFQCECAHLHVNETRSRYLDLSLLFRTSYELAAYQHQTFHSRATWPLPPYACNRHSVGIIWCHLNAHILGKRACLGWMRTRAWLFCVYTKCWESAILPSKRLFFFLTLFVPMADIKHMLTVATHDYQ